jgi:predicted transcriptional regulator
MVDITGRRIVDIIETRELEAVKEWLKTFPSLQYVSRDGSVTYKSAITQANEKIIQISDRFHLLKGLTDAAKKYITGYFKANIGLPVSESHYNGIKTDNFYWEKHSTCTDLPTREHLSTTGRKMELVAEARKLRQQGYAAGKIAELIGVTYATASKYLKSDFNPEQSSYNATYYSKIKPYAEEIKSMISQGRTFKEIESIIRQKGFAGAPSTIRMFATRERKLQKEAGGITVEKIERKWLVSLLYKPVDKVKGISQEQLDKVVDNNPVIGKVFDTVKSFKEILFSKKEAQLDAWIEDALVLGIEEINGFIGGIKRDLDAVKNAITYDFNNGLAEGSVNKLKVIKRIMYGRCNFFLLKSKVLNLENRRQFN